MFYADLAPVEADRPMIADDRQHSVPTLPANAGRSRVRH
jgi:hypothetical protein